MLTPKGVPSLSFRGVTLSFPRLWILFFFLASHFCRIGEAAVPGPDVDSFMDLPNWNLSTKPDFCLGIGNPGGISNKHHMFGSFPVGWWHLAETQASKTQQCRFQQCLRNISFTQERNIGILPPFDQARVQQAHGQVCLVSVIEHFARYHAHGHWGFLKVAE